MTRDLQNVERAPVAEAGLGRPPPRAAAPELVGMHGHLDAARATLSSRVARTADSSSTPSSVPDVLAPGLTCVFCGINPGRVSDAAAAHFANPRNDFWRLLHDAGFTPRLYDPQEQFSLLELGLRRHERRLPHHARARATCAAATSTPMRSTTGSSRCARARSRSSARRRTAGSTATRPELGPQLHSIGQTGLYVLPSTSPANAAVPYAERLDWFRALRDWLQPVEREAVRALVVDRDEAACCSSGSAGRAGTGRGGARPAAGSSPGESHEQALIRELLRGGRAAGVRARAARVRARRSSSRGRSGSTASGTSRISFASTSTSRRRPSISRRKVWRRCAGGRSTSSPLRGSSSRRPTCSSACVTWAVTAVLVTVHLLAAGIWFGGSTALVFVGVPAIRTLEGEPRGRAMKALGLRWRPLGYGALIVAALTGVVLASRDWQHSTAFPDRPVDEGRALRRVCSWCRTCTTSCSARGSRRRSATAVSSARARGSSSSAGSATR